MATGYHCSAKPVSRSGGAKGQSIVAKAAYNSREQLYNSATGKSTNDYRKGHSEVLFEGIFAPKDAPDWAKDRAALWSEVERYEDRTNSRFARSVEVAFPHQLTEQQREWVIKDFVRENFVREGMVADVAIHAPDKDGDERNYHAHILITDRRIGADGFEGNKPREWNKTATLESWREDWALKCGRMLERAGYQVEGDRWRSAHLTLGAQLEAALDRGDHEFAASCDHDAGKHLGPKIIEMMGRGIETDRSAEAVVHGMAHGVDQLVGKVASAVEKAIKLVEAVTVDLAETGLETLGSMFDAPKQVSVDDLRARVASRNQAEARRSEQMNEQVRAAKQENFEDDRRRQDEERRQREEQSLRR